MAHGRFTSSPERVRIIELCSKSASTFMAFLGVFGDHRNGGGSASQTVLSSVESLLDRDAVKP
jgi:hypothetical protein